MKGSSGYSPIAFAGPRFNGRDVGGVVVLFEDLVSSKSINHEIFDTNGSNYTFRIFMVACFFLACTKSAFQKREIGLHGTAKDFIFLGPILLLLKAFLNLKYHTRKFAGSFDQHYEAASPLNQFLVGKFLQHSECNFFETLHLVEYFRRFNPRTYWFPNYRGRSSYRSGSHFAGKFVFIGHVKAEKGIQTLLELSKIIPPGWIIDIYGTLVDYSEADFSPDGAVRYKGSLRPNEVQSLLSRYNCLILPSYREGYPGVIIEAFSVALPVIATKLPSLQEMVCKNSGVLTEPGSTSSVLNAMKKVASDYQEFRTGSLERFEAYEKEKVLGRYFQTIGVTR